MKYLSKGLVWFASEWHCSKLCFARVAKGYIHKGTRKVTNSVSESRMLNYKCLCTS